MTLSAPSSRGLAIGLLMMTAGCVAPGLSAEPAADGELITLQTQVAALADAQAAQATALSDQTARTTRLGGIVSDLATAMPRFTSTQYPPTMTPYTTTQGGVILESGRCCVGGMAGAPLTLHADLHPRSQAGAVTEMRLHVGASPASVHDMGEEAWVPYVSQTTLTIKPALNWVGIYVSVQFRDAQGVLSEVFWDDISVEGMPPVPSSAP
jgi:hypothetical protein